MHLAELNIAIPIVPPTDPLLRDFVDNLDRINALADRSPGFVWRYLADFRDGPDAHFGDGIPNLSVWETVETLERFTFGTVHRQIYARRHEWMRMMKNHHFVMWWVAPGHRPDMAEAAARLDHLNAHGDSDHAFGWNHVAARLQFQDARCDGEPA